MKKIISILLITLVLFSLVITPSASSLNFSYFGINGTYSTMSGEYSGGGIDLPQFESIDELSGVNTPNGSGDLELTFVLRMYAKDNGDYDFKAYMNQRFIPNYIWGHYGYKYSFAESVNFFQLGDKSRQNNFSYDFISFERMDFITEQSEWEFNRIAFLSSPYGNDQIYKTPADWREYFEIEFTIYFDNYKSNLPVTYDIIPGEANARYDDIIAVDPSHYIYPIYQMKDYGAYIREINGWTDTWYPPNMQGFLALQGVKYIPDQSAIVRSTPNRTHVPTSVFYCNFVAPIHNRVYWQNDTRYDFLQSFTSSTMVSLGYPGSDQTSGNITSEMTSDSLINPYTSFKSYNRKVDTAFYYTALTTDENAVYEVDHFRMYLIQRLNDPYGFDIFYRTSGHCNESQYHSTTNGFYNYPLSFGAWVLYKPETGIKDFIVNSSNNQVEFFYDDLYVDVAPEGDNVFEKLGNIFTQTIPNIFNNAIIWLMCESPLLSKITRPIYISAVSAGDIVSTIAIPLVSSLGIVGVVYATIFIIKILARLLHK